MSWACAIVRCVVRAGAADDHVTRLGEDHFNTLFAGTQVLQTKPPSDSARDSSRGCASSSESGRVLAMCIRSGFATSKGRLVLSILFPRPSSFRFVTQSYYFVGCLFVVAAVGFVIR